MVKRFSRDTFCNLTPNEASVLCGLPPYSLKHRADAGLLSVERTNGGHRRYRKDEILKLAERVKVQP